MVYLAGTNQSIDTGNTYMPEIAQLGIQGSVIARSKITERVRIAKMPQSTEPPLKARINYSRWIVDCPNCSNAEFAFEDSLFLCSQCKNGDVGGKVRKVEMPTDRTQIESILANRKIINRHWYPTETIKQLEDENKLHGIALEA